MGLLYKSKRPNKISLIQSAALFNAVIVRQPDNQRFQDDLHDLCKHVLNCATADQNVANLVGIAKRVKTQMVEMRDNVNTCSKNLIKIPDDTDKSMTVNETQQNELTFIKSSLRKMVYPTTTHKS